MSLVDWIKWLTCPGFESRVWEKSSREIYGCHAWSEEVEIVNWDKNVNFEVNLSLVSDY